MKHFLKEFPTAKMNRTLIREFYRRHDIKKKKLRWYKVPKKYDSDKAK